MRRRVPRVLGAALMVAVSPLLIAASDPRADLRPCPSGHAAVGDPPDLIGGSAVTEEGGHGLAVTLRFAEPLRVPDPNGHPFRVDVLLRDPSVPAVSFRYYHDLNRILRFDAGASKVVQILLLPERGQNVFYGVTVDADTLTLRVPGRLITRDVDIQGPALESLRWGVIVRDEHRCDFLGDGRPSYPVVAGAGSSIAPVPVGGRSVGSGSVPVGLIVAAAIVMLLAGAAAFRLIRRRAAAPASRSPGTPPASRPEGG